MDASQLAQVGMNSGAVAVLLLLYRVCVAVRGHLIVSRCCGRRLEMGYDVRPALDTVESDGQTLESPFLTD